MAELRYNLRYNLFPLLPSRVDDKLFFFTHRSFSSLFVTYKRKKTTISTTSTYDRFQEWIINSRIYVHLLGGREAWTTGYPVEMHGARCPCLECRLIIHNALTALFIHKPTISAAAMPRIAAPHRIRLILLMKLHRLRERKEQTFFRIYLRTKFTKR